LGRWYREWASVSSARRRRHGVGRGKTITDPSPGTIPQICSPSPVLAVSCPPPFRFTQEPLFFFYLLSAGTAGKAQRGEGVGGIFCFFPPQVGWITTMPRQVIPRKTGEKLSLEYLPRSPKIYFLAVLFLIILQFSADISVMDTGKYRTLVLTGVFSRSWPTRVW
jgi:hypothetical protein